MVNLPNFTKIRNNRCFHNPDCHSKHNKSGKYLEDAVRLIHHEPADEKWNVDKNH